MDNPAPPVLEGLKYIDSITYYKGYKELLVGGAVGIISMDGIITVPVILN